MADKAKKDLKTIVTGKVDKAREVLKKHADKPGNDGKRRLAAKKLKRSQRRLAKMEQTAKHFAARTKKKKSEGD